MTEEELAELRVHKPAEVARMLNIPVTRLERWVRENRVRHLRAGVSRGVEFKAEHIRQISQMLPELQAGRRCGRPGSTPDGQRSAAPSRPGPSEEQVAGWAQLRAHRPTPPVTPLAAVTPVRHDVDAVARPIPTPAHRQGPRD